MSKETFRRREDGQGINDPAMLNVTNRESDADYFGNLKKFERHEDMAAEPTRGGQRSK